MRTWKVRYQDMEAREARHPFFNKAAYVTAPTRKEAIAKVSGMFPPPRYGRYAAAPTDRPAAHFFQEKEKS